MIIQPQQSLICCCICLIYFFLCQGKMENFKNRILRQKMERVQINFRRNSKLGLFANLIMGRSPSTTYLLRGSNSRLQPGGKAVVAKVQQEAGMWPQQPVWHLAYSQLFQQQGMHVILWPSVLLRGYNHFRVYGAFLAYLRIHLGFQEHQKIFIFLCILIQNYLFSPLRYNSLTEILWEL